ncbi:SusC/RagA family TonB-linked outer membrane protein [Chitinophaga barathri]|uniref:TonB-dependent receptor n=2 Tax=Chitinophaga barathri TaxID=1647451 RepID=A0A3N4M7Q7_9BACT|nr:TonB-dependent receptor [Chitinophaga barathri]RPD39502.1 TonB-dependent receptor [Chitinophaga barathri]
MLLMHSKKKLPSGRLRLACQTWRGLLTLLLLLAGITAFAGPHSTAYDKKISGKVTDGTGTGLPGVSIALKGTSTGTVTNPNGEYTISVPDTGAVLIFRFVGYNVQEIAVGAQPRVDVVMTTSAKGLNELVVVGYGTQKKVNLTGAVTAVNAGELVNLAPSNLSNALAGRAPGVNVTNTSGLAGASSSIRIRGSFGDPLFVIDGVVRDKEAFDALEAAEVDQMSFLKDAATASIYGSRAGNGVVLVTTKKGTSQKPVFNFQTNYTTNRPTMTLHSDKTTSTDELIYQNRVAAFQGTALPNGQAEFDYFKDKKYNVNDFIWQNPWSMRHSLSVSGGSDRITYYSMLSYRAEEGSYKSLEHKKVNLRSNVTAKVSDAIKVNLNISAFQENQDRFFWPFGSAENDDEYDVSDIYRVTFNWPKTFPFFLTADGQPADYITPYPVQPVMGSFQAWNVIDQVVGNRYINLRKRQMNAILGIDISLEKFVKGLTSKVVGNYVADDYMRKRFMTYQKAYSFVPAQPNGNRFIPGPPDENKVVIFNFSQNQPFTDYRLSTLWSYQLNWFLNYNRTFNKHGIDALVVFEQAENGGYGAVSRAENPIPLENIDQAFAYSGDRQFRDASAWEEVGARQSWIGRANYNYDGKYIAEFSFRYDGNTLFPAHKRWGFFPSVSAAWRISEENFFRNTTSFFDELKIRASYGTTGNDLNVANQRIAPFSYRNYFVNAGSYMFGDRLYTTVRPGPIPNPDLTWATSTSYNAGLDFSILKSRLNGTIDVFLRKETDILGSREVKLPDNYGIDLAPENYAARSFRGGELTLEWRDRAAGNKINYSVTGNLGYAKDQWDIYDETAIFGPAGNRNFESRIGRPENRIVGYKSLGIIRTQQELDALLSKNFTQFGRKPYLGALLYEDVRGDAYAPGADGKIDANDMQLLSTNATPRINFGMGINVSWKNWALQTFFQGVTSYDRIISNQEGAGMRQHGGNVRPYYPIWAGDVYTPETPDGKYPRPVGQSGWAEAGAAASSFWIRNGAYFRMKMLNLAYNLPQNWTRRIGLSSAQLYFNGTNLFAFSGMKEFHDPEQKNYDSYPVMKAFTFGADIKF